VTERSRTGIMLSGLAWLAAGVVIAACAALACDTPVYEYTIQHWQRDRYYVHYFHEGKPAADDAQVNQYLERVARGTEGHVNLGFASVDVTKLGEASPLGQRRIWSRHKSDRLPFHVITSPRGGEVFAGRLDAQTSRTLVGSPKRTDLAEQLCEGRQGVLVTLLGPDQGENAAAQKTVSEIVARSRSENLDVGVLRVARDDARERWFVRQLLAVEDDLKDIPKPMVFGAFGRGYVLPPYLGKGITARNMAELVAFINGPCACEIKASNPGADLLTDWDWEAHLANWSGSGAAAPGFVLFDVQEQTGAEPIVQMPVLGSAQAGSTAARDDDAPPAGAGKEHRQPQPAGEPTERAGGPNAEAASAASEAAPAGKQRTSTPRDNTPAQHAADQPADASVRQEDDPAKPDSEAEAAEEQSKPETQTAKPGEEARGPRLSVSRPAARPTEADLEAEQGALLGSVLSLRLGLTLGAAAILALAGGLLLARRGRDR
jgi:hypothetical protein